MRHKEDNIVALIQKCWCEEKRDWDYVQVSVAKEDMLSLGYDAYNAEKGCVFLFFFLVKDSCRVTGKWDFRPDQQPV